MKKSTGSRFSLVLMLEAAPRLAETRVIPPLSQISSHPNSCKRVSTQDGKICFTELEFQSKFNTYRFQTHIYLTSIQDGMYVNVGTITDGKSINL